MPIREPDDNGNLEIALLVFFLGILIIISLRIISGG